MTPHPLKALPRWLIGALLMIAAPGIACFGYYSLADAGDVGAAAGALIVLAYPLALIGLCALVALAVSPARKPRRLAAAALCFVLPALFLLVIRH